MVKLIFALLFLISCSGEKRLIEITGNTMGTYYRVKAYTDKDEANLKKDIDKFLILFNNIFSTYIKDSEISLINSSNAKKFPLTPTLQNLFALSKDIHRKSAGYFDITVGPLVNLWGFGPDGKKKKPSDSEINEVLTQVGSKFYTINDNKLELNKKLYFDFSAIAKGFGVDELVKFLEYKGISDLLVEIGGEVRTRGYKADGVNWVIGIEGPSNIIGEKLQKIVPLKNMSMATSGSYRNFIKYGDEVFNHTINPFTGRPAKHQTVSVSVLHEYCSSADAWATAFMSMGFEKGMELANRLDLMVFFQYKNNGKIQTQMSREFEKYMAQFDKDLK